MIVLAGFAFYYMETSSNIQTMDSKISSQQQMINNLGAQITSIQEHTVTLTVTTTSTSVVTSTTTAFPSPDNVTVYFQNSGSIFNYAIHTASQSYTGSTSNSAVRIQVTPVFRGEGISISASCGGTCPSGMTFSALLYVNDSLVAQSSGNAFTGLSILYTL